MARPLTRAQALQNRIFLKALARTGNVRFAARAAGIGHSAMHKRRSNNPAFAVRWDSALATAQARLNSGGPRRAQTGRAQSARGAFSPLRTEGGEPVVIRRRNGRLQVRAARPGAITRECEQAFLAALSVTANVRLAAAAVGVAHSSFYWRKRTDPAFAREMRMAIARGYEALELALLESTLPAAHEHDDWRHNSPPAMPPMSANQALQLMYLHQKAALLVDEPTPMRRRRGESNEARNERLALMAEARDRRAREAFAIAEVERMERGEPAWGLAGEALRQAQDERFGFDPARLLPDLAQVTGWSNADPAKAAHDPERALFGGWRIAQMEAKLLHDWCDEASVSEEEGAQPAAPRIRRL